MIIMDQDKTLITDDINISVDKNFSGGLYRLSNKDVILGYYKTEERAKEVLQEIAEYYECSKHEMAYSNIRVFKSSAKDFVYEMPKE